MRTIEQLADKYIPIHHKNRKLEFKLELYEILKQERILGANQVRLSNQQNIFGFIDWLNVNEWHIYKFTNTYHQLTGDCITKTKSIDDLYEIYKLESFAKSIKTNNYGKRN